VGLGSLSVSFLFESRRLAPGGFSFFTPGQNKIPHLLVKDFCFAAKARRAYKPFVASLANNLEIGWQFLTKPRRCLLVRNFVREPKLFLSLRDGGEDFRHGHAVRLGMRPKHLFHQ
jgi:hypothetical protein